jgi:hypothetical protein
MSDSESTCLGKRQRVETDHGTPLRRGIKQKPGEDWVDDEDFYFQDGDVTILAERTRFRVRDAVYSPENMIYLIPTCTALAVCAEARLSSDGKAFRESKPRTIYNYGER